VTIELACVPGEKHVVKINGEEHRGVVSSDLNFARLVLLAAHKKADQDVYGGGWVRREELFIDEKWHELEKLSKALARDDSCGELYSDDLKLLVRRHPDKIGKLRLALAPENITIDDSVKEFEPLNLPKKTSGTSNSKKYRKDLETAHERARKMIQDAVNILTKLTG